MSNLGAVRYLTFDLKWIITFLQSLETYSAPVCQISTQSSSARG